MGVRKGKGGGGGVAHLGPLASSAKVKQKLSYTLNPFSSFLLDGQVII